MKKKGGGAGSVYKARLKDGSFYIVRGSFLPCSLDRCIVLLQRISRSLVLSVANAVVFLEGNQKTYCGVTALFGR